LLARLFAQPANLLVLDEPTNDLDLETLELLESLLQDYGGTLFLVSHDRAFLDNVVTQSIAFEGNGVVREYAGGYSDWLRPRQAGTAAKAKPKEPARRSQPQPSREQTSVKLSYKETRELDALPERIAALEAEQAEITRQLADAAVYRDQPAGVQALQSRYSAIEDELMQCLSRWEELEARQARS
jgi:ATP-binding cassette subfamily F protein uup